jgi:hypothetical protein
MEFVEKGFDSRRPFTFQDFVYLAFFLGLAGVSFYWPISMIGSREPTILIALSYLGYVFGICFLGGLWSSYTVEKIELVNSPREARCWRKHLITRRTSYRCYKIRDDAKVVIKTRRGGGRAHTPYYWPIVITGLPRGYDFWGLAGCKTLDDAARLSRSIASYLGIPLFEGKDEIPLDALPDRPWTGPRPEQHGHHEHRRRRKR